ncbi:MAG: hypothetical protein WBQ03_11360, partial [Candidatus Sulfotelmatobacter sp.]
MAVRMISIWFFIGISLAVNGALILAAGIYQLIDLPANPGVVLFHLHANVWWGAMLLAIGILYSLKFAPRRQS